MKNYYWGAFIITLTVIVVLSSLYKLPSKIFNIPIRKVDMLSDIRYRNDTSLYDTISSINDSLLKSKRLSYQYVDTCKNGIECIMDYSDSTNCGMSHFYNILDSVEYINRPVRIAVFGDSFIEGDIFTSDLRTKFQQKYGGVGVGFINMSSNIAGFRPTVLHKFNGWKEFSVNDSIYTQSYLGINSSYYVAEGSGSWVELICSSKYSPTAGNARKSIIYFDSNNDTTELRYSVNNGPVNHEYVYGKGLRQCMVSDDIKSIKWMVGDSCDAVFYGISLEDDSGVQVDNFSLRGSAGYNIMQIPEGKLKAFANLRKYDMIILQYGLNVATEYGSDYSSYHNAMSKVIAKIKRCFRGSSILVMSVGDRKMKDENGDFVTMPGVKNLVKYQELIAADNHVAFWNLYNQFLMLGGIDSFVKSEPPMANLDYTHINFRGGRKLAGLLYEALIYGKDNYDRRILYESNK